MDDYISRSYAISRIEMAMMEEDDPDVIDQFKRFVLFIDTLPSLLDLDEYVYCTDCENFRTDGEECFCRYADICYFYDPEDSARRYLRPCYCQKRKE